VSDLIRYFNAYVLFPLLEKKSKRQIAPKFKELKQFNTLALGEQNRIQREALYKVLTFSKAKIPYYMDLFRQTSFDENKVLKDIRFVQDLPLLTKEIIRDNSDRIKLPEAIHPRKTGGSTGQSVFFYYDDVGLDWTAAINLMAYEMAGNFPYRKDCHISSELGFGKPPLKHRFLDWLKLFSQNRKRLMLRSFSDEDLKNTFKNLKRIHPYLLQGHPSSGYALANYIKKHNLKKKKYCSVFEPSGEMLTQKMVEAMETYLGCKVVNRYGNAEFGVMAHTRPQDPYTKLQIFNRTFYIEEVEQDNLIVTNFTNFSMPLIRYNTGDIGTVKNEAEGSFIYNIQGRVHDSVMIDHESYATHFIMDYLDHKIGRIREFQIITRGKNSLPTLSVVPEDPTDQERIRTALEARWPKGLAIQFVRYEDLKKVGWQNKFRHVIVLGDQHE